MKHIFRMVLQTHLQCQIISITPATKYKHHSTTILIYIVTSGCTTTSWFLNSKTLFLMCKMIIHYRTYLQNGITNTFAMPIISITPATKYKHHSTAILIHTVTSAWCTTPWFFNWMTLFLMCKMIIHYRTYLQNGITNTFAMPNNFYITSNQIQTPFNYYFDTYSDNWMMYYTMVF